MAAKPIVTQPNQNGQSRTIYGSSPDDRVLDISRSEIDRIVFWTTGINGFCPVCRSAIMISPREDCLCHPCESLLGQLNAVINPEDGNGGYYTRNWGIDDQWWHPFIPAIISIDEHSFGNNATLDDLKWFVGEVYEWSVLAERAWDAIDKLTRGNWGWKPTEFPNPVLISGSSDYDQIELELDRGTAVAQVIRWALTGITDRSAIHSVFSLVDWVARSFSPRDTDWLVAHITEDAINHNEMTGCSWFDDITRHIVRWMPYDRYLKTFHWMVTRDRALERAGKRCQVCNAGGLLDVHHRTYERRGAELPEDLIVLCRSCHETFHKNGRLARGD
jgi:hypothetical protein